MKIAVVVERYGADINGGEAELHARYVAEHLAATRRGDGCSRRARGITSRGSNELPRKGPQLK